MSCNVNDCIDIMLDPAESKIRLKINYFYSYEKNQKKKFITEFNSQKKMNFILTLRV